MSNESKHTPITDEQIEALEMLAELGDIHYEDGLIITAVLAERDALKAELKDLQGQISSYAEDLNTPYDTAVSLRAENERLKKELFTEEEMKNMWGAGTLSYDFIEVLSLIKAEKLK